MKEEKFYRILEYTGVFVITGILFVLLIVDNRFHYVYQNFCKIPNLLFAALTAGILGGYYFLQKKKLFCSRMRKKKKIVSETVVKLRLKLERRNLIILSIFLLGVQMIVAWQIYFKTGWDCGKLVQMAQEVAYHYRDIGDDLYFSMYPNNVLLVAVFATVLRFTKFLGFNADYFPLVMIGCLLVNMAGFFMADCIRQLTRKSWIALAAWGMYMVLAGLSPWISIPYSDTYSILFPIFCIWLYMNRTSKNKYMVGGGIAFVGWLGGYIKPTVLLVVFGMIALELWHFFCNYRKKERRKFFKSTAGVVAAVLLGLLLAASVNEVACQKMGFTPMEGKKFTPLHYVMMGLNYDTGGTYDQGDVNDSAAAASVSQRNHNALQQIGRRLSDMGVTGLAAHTTRKLLTNFNDGTFAWGKEGEFYWNIQEKNNGLSRELRNYYYESGSYYPVFQIISQAMWILVLGFILCLVIPGKRNPDRTTAAVLLGILEIICFVMLFEARARYLYLYSPVFILAAALGLERFLKWVEEKQCDKATQMMIAETTVSQRLSGDSGKTS